MINLLKYIAVTLVLLLTAACAIRVTPTGGEKDTTPPKVLSAAPDTFSTNFSSKTIEFEFDEYFQLNDLSNKLVISPPMEKPPVPKIKGKKLILELQELLRPNTTYNFNFGAAIADINENTPMNDFSYVFSTGSYIDSLSVGGAVVNAFTGASEKDVTLLLYTSDTDSLPYKEKPAYFAKTDGTGNFKLGYIAPGNYKIFALKETNNNYLLDSDDEQIAFIDTLINPEKASNVVFKLFQPEKRKQKVLKSEYAQPGKVSLVFNRPVKDFKLRYLNNTADTNFYTAEKGKIGDSLTLWLKGKQADTLRFVAYDNGPIDTLTFYTAKGKKRVVTRGSAERPDTLLSLTPRNLKGGKLDRTGKIVFRFNHPVDSIDFSKVKLYSDKDLITYKTELEPTLHRTLTLFYPFTDETDYRVLFEKGAVLDMFGYKNDSTNYAFTLRPERDYGSLTLNLTLPEKGGSYILQLLNDKDDVLRDIPVTTNQKIDFGLLEPGTYTYRLIDDGNGNGKWDTGNYLLHKQPEGVLYSTERPAIRGAWDLDTEWNLNKKEGGLRGK